MTRINVIPVEYLLDQHLMAEYRELPMVGAALRRSLKSPRGVTGIPSEYTLNGGHVKFFYNKHKYLSVRYEQLVHELKRRKFNIDPASRNNNLDVFLNTPFEQVDYTPKSVDKVTNVLRIINRYLDKPNFYKYKGKKIDYLNFLESHNKWNKQT